MEEGHLLVSGGCDPMLGPCMEDLVTLDGDDGMELS